MSAPPFESVLPIQSDALDKIKLKAHNAAYDLLVVLNTKATSEKWLQICTSESLTAGLIMSTLVDIPWGGYLKYGCFGVYDTDAKRVFNGVSIDDVYTHRCAKEMAVGILRNSNASLAISVTGNAMPLNDHADMVGEVFIGVAGYKMENGTPIIAYATTSINACIDTDIADFKSLCKVWYDTIKKNQKYNPRDRTALMSQEIRNYTAYKALTFCLEFVNKNELVVPDLVWNRKKQNDEKSNQNSNHLKIPPVKFPDSFQEICVTEPCHDVKTPKRVNTQLFSSTGGRRKTRRRSTRL